MEDRISICKNYFIVESASSSNEYSYKKSYEKSYIFYKNSISFEAQRIMTFLLKIVKYFQDKSYFYFVFVKYLSIFNPAILKKYRKLFITVR